MCTHTGYGTWFPTPALRDQAWQEKTLWGFMQSWGACKVALKGILKLPIHTSQKGMWLSLWNRCRKVLEPTAWGCQPQEHASPLELSMHFCASHRKRERGIKEVPLYLLLMERVLSGLWGELSFTMIFLLWLLYYCFFGKLRIWSHLLVFLFPLPLPPHKFPYLIIMMVK